MTKQFSPEFLGRVAGGLRRTVASSVVPADAVAPPRAANGILGLMRRWREHEQLRRELSMMRPGDFGDLAVPYSMVIAETRKWPWQKVSPQWGEIRFPAGIVVKRGEF